jgi:hypothetical protein
MTDMTDVTETSTTNEFDQHDAEPVTPDARAARPRTASLLEDEQRAAFLAEWDAVQTGFIADPRRAAEAAERLVATLADSVMRRVGEIADAVAQPTTDTGQGAVAGEPAPDEETWREQLLRCREAFHLLIDS